MSVPRCLVCSDLVLPVCTGRGEAAQHLGPAAPQPQTWLRCPGNSGEEEKQVGTRLQPISQDFRDCPSGSLQHLQVGDYIYHVIFKVSALLAWPSVFPNRYWADTFRWMGWYSTVLCGPVKGSEKNQLPAASLLLKGYCLLGYLKMFLSAGLSPYSFVFCGTSPGL